MKEPQTYEIYYDKEADFLEVFFGEPTQARAEEIEEGVFIRRDNKTNEVKSIGILSFKKRVEILKKILDKFNLEIPISVGLN
ncbi:MAG: DUF2283 domain-containing protein [Nanoarchaeota archaeon]|nr:DUF2283 domain-containing protein [Nanoarchaeota archaeon]